MNRKSKKRQKGWRYSITADGKVGEMVIQKFPTNEQMERAFDKLNPPEYRRLSMNETVVMEQ